jgi:hypothetical protein
MNTFYWNNSKLRNILLCVLLKTVMCKYWQDSFIEPDLKHVFLNSCINSNAMFFLTILHIHFIETTQNYTIFWYMYCLRQQKATYLMKNKHETCVAIYWNLSHNAISVIKYNTFNNLPNLICIWVSFCIIDWKVCSLYDNICIRKCFFYIKQVVDKCALRTLQICHRYGTSA